MLGERQSRADCRELGESSASEMHVWINAAGNASVHKEVKSRKKQSMVHFFKQPKLYMVAVKDQI